MKTWQSQRTRTLDCRRKHHFNTDSLNGVKDDIYAITGLAAAENHLTERLSAQYYRDL